MDKKFLKYYEDELTHIRDMAQQFSRQFPKIAGRLDLDNFDCADPYAERLLEGFAFLTSRVQMKMDAEFPRFTEAMLNVSLPHFLKPMPSMMIAQFCPEEGNSDLAAGFEVSRKTRIYSHLDSDTHTSCTYNTAHNVTVWPLKISALEYHTHDIEHYKLPHSKAKAALRIELELTADIEFAELECDELSFFLSAPQETADNLYEQLFSSALGVYLQDTSYQLKYQHKLSSDSILPQGFDDDDALLPVDARTFSGYRLLQEYFAFPERFLFFKVKDLLAGFQQANGNKIDLIIPFSEELPDIAHKLDTSSLSLNCTPAINLFKKNCDRINISDKQYEYQLLPDRTRPLDYEVYGINNTVGYGTKTTETLPFAPFYHPRQENENASNSYFCERRSLRNLSQHEEISGSRSSYFGTDVFLSLVDSKQAPYDSHLRELAVEALCTNRDLPIKLRAEKEEFHFELSGPIDSIRSVGRISTPRLAKLENSGNNWEAISHLSKNYQTLMNKSGVSSQALRDVLMLYCDQESTLHRRLIDGLRDISCEGITRKIRAEGRICFVRGLEVKLAFDEKAYKGTGVFIMGAVLNRYLNKYVTVNSFIETVICSTERGEIKRWPVNIGNHQLL